MNAAIQMSVMWIATSVLVAFATYFTGSPNCLWAMLIPAFVATNNQG